MKLLIQNYYRLTPTPCQPVYRHQLLLGLDALVFKLLLRNAE